MCKPYLMLIFQKLGLSSVITELIEFLNLANDVNLFCLSNESMSQLHDNQVFQYSMKQFYGPGFSQV